TRAAARSVRSTAPSGCAPTTSRRTASPTIVSATPPTTSTRCSTATSTVSSARCSRPTNASGSPRWRAEVSAVRELLGAATDRLVAAGVESARFDAEELLAFVLGVRRLELRFVDDVTAAQQVEYESLVARRAERVPLQHLTGTAP